ncbi:hypothetical protein RUM44_012435 [Polyplax serrata]|uniref:Uncharacterized protein n=1 Tax=Polyplax serrata TaxID=468196 RepID=A0ABR1BBA6_POLSC
MLVFVQAVLVLFLLSASGGQQCKNDLGEPVDWFIAYKIPMLKNQTNNFIKKGIGYMYISSQNSTADWKLSSRSVNDSNSFLGQTLAPLYKASFKDLFYIMYNDEPPNVPGNNLYGHSKGVVITNGTVGVWLIHSSPKFPIEPVTTKKLNITVGVLREKVKNKYFFPKTAARFGQSFLCLSLPANQMNKVGLALQYIRPKIYSSNVPPSLELKFLELVSAAMKKYVQKPPYRKKIPLKTLGGRDFVSYAKSKEFNKDLYSDWLASDLQSDLDVEAWSNGRNELPSDCNKKFHVMDVKAVSIKADSQDLEFKNSQDHSKWAITINSNKSVVCIGDINRMLAQFKRGGGTVCYKNAFVWKKYAKSVAAVQPCPRVKPKGFFSKIFSLF